MFARVFEGCGKMLCAPVDSMRILCDTALVGGNEAAGETRRQAMTTKAASAAGRALGRLAAGKPKNYSVEELARRAEWARGLAAKRKAKQEASK